MEDVVIVNNLEGPVSAQGRLTLGPTFLLAPHLARAFRRL
jgi:hypothetical protein